MLSIWHDLFFDKKNLFVPWIIIYFGEKLIKLKKKIASDTKQS